MCLTNYVSDKCYNVIVINSCIYIYNIKFSNCSKSIDDVFKKHIRIQDEMLSSLWICQRNTKGNMNIANSHQLLDICANQHPSNH